MPCSSTERERGRERQTNRKTGAVYLLSSLLLSPFQPCYLSSELPKFTLI